MVLPIRISLSAALEAGADIVTRAAAIRPSVNTRERLGRLIPRGRRLAWAADDTWSHARRSTSVMVRILPPLAPISVRCAAPPAILAILRAAIYVIVTP